MVIANITPLFPLITNLFVIIIFGIQLYIAKIIAMYEQKDRFHSYITQPITNIQKLLYVSLQVYTHIQDHIFTDFITDEFGNNFFLFSHCNLKYIVYNIETTNVQIEGNILFLKGVARTVFTNLNDIKFCEALTKF